MPHVSISNVLDEKGRLRNLQFVFGEYAGASPGKIPIPCRYENNPVPDDVGEKLSGARTEVLEISHAHHRLTLVENNFRGLSSLRELTVDDTE